MNTVRKINGFNFYFETLDFQGDNEKFYIIYHQDISFESFDIIINRRWINEIGFEEAMKCVSNVWDNPKKAAEMTLGEYWAINSKIKYYREMALLDAQNKIQETKDFINNAMELKKKNREEFIRINNEMLEILRLEEETKAKIRALKMKRVSNE